jgi:hypothetical protein
MRYDQDIIDKEEIQSIYIYEEKEEYQIIEWFHYSYILRYFNRGIWQEIIMNFDNNCKEEEFIAQDDKNFEKIFHENIE